jgi:hypothetical protein
MRSCVIKEIYCRDCRLLLAKFNTEYFSDNTISEIVRVQYRSHIKDGHSLSTREPE